MTAKKLVIYSILFFICAVALIGVGIHAWSGQQWFDKPISVLAILVGIFALIASISLFITRHYPGPEKKERIE